jgi:hypothetical protein
VCFWAGAKAWIVGLRRTHHPIERTREADNFLSEYVKAQGTTCLRAGSHAMNRARSLLPHHGHMLAIIEKLVHLEMVGLGESMVRA